MGKRATAGVAYRLEEKLKPYEDALCAAGLDVVRIQAGSSSKLDGLGGLVLTGGTDVDPSIYGEEPAPETQPPDRERDEMELNLLLQALSVNLPVLAICRGMQLFNVAQGGALIQHLGEGNPHTRGKDVDQAHSIMTVEGTQLSRILGPGEYMVNSRHHQAVDPNRIGNGLIVSAKSPDGVIEGLEMPGQRFAIAVQWHPEDLFRQDARLFHAFAEAV
ncbi:MAG: gamma-glutamyl-gamma-aminobutyrate hydrolase family protein [Bryobacterales bacterium]|nr:gamma-glutamyl-gamma-aminobutyrate hydrolase family protein [Bryobacterales bacterium]